MSATVEDFFVQATKLQGELSESKQTVKDLRKQIQSLEAERDGLTSRVTELSGEVEVLRVKAGNVEAVQNHSDAVEQQLRILEAKIAEDAPIVAVVSSLADQVLKLANKGR